MCILPQENKAFECLHHLSTLINQAVGDAISDLLFGVVCLAALDWTLDDWNNVYTELPFRNTKVLHIIFYWLTIKYVAFRFFVDFLFRLVFFWYFYSIRGGGGWWWWWW